MYETKKFVVFGLDNSGKTAIVHSLKGDNNLLSFCAFKPTVDYKIEKIVTASKEFRIWDFGGQEKYRTKHIDRIDENLAHASKIIFVIDVQDRGRYDEALSYLSLIMDHVDDPDVEVSIFLHKTDPPVNEPSSEPWDKNVDDLVGRLRVMIPTHLNVKMFKTSVYTVFHKVPVV